MAAPDSRPETQWLGRIQELDFDSSSGHLLGLQPSRGNVVEFTPGGELVVTYGGRRGQGPGEVRRVVDFATARHAVALLDRGNGRVLVYERSGELGSEFSVASHHRSISFVENDIVLAPGTDGAALDAYRSSGTLIGSLGRAADLLSVVPSAAEFRDGGYQLWSMDPASGSYERYAYPRGDVGFLAAGSGTRLFALNPVTGEVVQFAFPGESAR